MSIRPEEGGVGSPEVEITVTCKLFDVGAGNRTLKEQGVFLNHRPVSLVLLRIRIIFKNTLLFYPKEKPWGQDPLFLRYLIKLASLIKLWDLFCI